MTSSDTTPATTAPEAAARYERRWLVLAVLSVAQLMVIVDVTITNVALPSAQADLGFSTSSREWVITAYALAFGSLLFLGGRLADLWGRKQMFIASAIGFALASVLGGAAPNLELLIAARALQGVFAAVLAPATLALVSTTFIDPTERSRAFAIFGTVTGAAGAIGLLLGGVLTDLINWRWCMYVNVGFAAIAVAGGLALLARIASESRPKLDLFGALTASTGVFFVVFALNRSQISGWDSASALVSYAVGAIAIAAFIAVEQRAKHPLLPLRIVANRSRGTAYAALFLASFSLLGLFLFLTYYLQGVVGYSPIKTGLAFLPLPLGLAVAAVLAESKVITRLGVRNTLVLGLLLGGVGSLVLAQISPTSRYLEVVLPGLALFGLGLGFAFVVALGLATADVEPSDAGAAGAMANASQQIGGAVGVALLSTVAAGATERFLHGREVTQAIASNAVTHGFEVGFYWSTGSFALAAAFALFVLGRNATLGEPVGPLG